MALNFEASINASIDKIFKDLDARISQATRFLFKSVVKLTPSPAFPGKYASGLLANQWYPQINGYSNQVSSATSPNGADSLSRIAATVKDGTFYRKDGMVSLSNNLEHAYRAEVLGWPAPEWKGTRGPYAMVATSMRATVAINWWKLKL
jgi:hypothetical protein